MSHFKKLLAVWGGPKDDKKGKTAAAAAKQQPSAADTAADRARAGSTPVGPPLNRSKTTGATPAAAAKPSGPPPSASSGAAAAPAPGAAKKNHFRQNSLTPKSACIVLSCVSARFNKGYCLAHYKRWEKGENLTLKPDQKEAAAPAAAAGAGAKSAAPAAGKLGAAAAPTAAHRATVAAAAGSKSASNSTANSAASTPVTSPRGGPPGPVSPINGLRYDDETDFLDILVHPLGLQSFMTFLKGEFSTENLEFWIQSRALTTTAPEATGSAASIAADRASWLSRAKHLHNEFIKAGGNSQVNISAALAAQVGAAVNTTDVAIVVEAFKRSALEILALMRSDSFRRFQRHKLWAEFKATVHGWNEKNRALVPPATVAVPPTPPTKLSQMLAERQAAAKASSSSAPTAAAAAGSATAAHTKPATTAPAKSATVAPAAASATSAPATAAPASTAAAASTTAPSPLPPPMPVPPPSALEKLLEAEENARKQHVLDAAVGRTTAGAASDAAAPADVPPSKAAWMGAQQRVSLSTAGVTAEQKQALSSHAATAHRRTRTPQAIAAVTAAPSPKHSDSGSSKPPPSPKTTVAATTAAATASTAATVSLNDRLRQRSKSSLYVTAPAGSPKHGQVSTAAPGGPITTTTTTAQRSPNSGRNGAGGSARGNGHRRSGSISSPFGVAGRVPASPKTPSGYHASGQSHAAPAPATAANAAAGPVTAAMRCATAGCGKPRVKPSHYCAAHTPPASTSATLRGSFIGVLPAGTSPAATRAPSHSVAHAPGNNNTPPKPSAAAGGAAAPPQLLVAPNLPQFTTTHSAPVTPTHGTPMAAPPLLSVAASHPNTNANANATNTAVAGTANGNAKAPAATHTTTHPNSSAATTTTAVPASSSSTNYSHSQPQTHAQTHSATAAATNTAVTIEQHPAAAAVLAAAQHVVAAKPAQPHSAVTPATAAATATATATATAAGNALGVEQPPLVHRRSVLHSSPAVAVAAPATATGASANAHANASTSAAAGSSIVSPPVTPRTLDGAAFTTPTAHTGTGSSGLPAAAPALNTNVSGGSNPATPRGPLSPASGALSPTAAVGPGSEVPPQPVRQTNFDVEVAALVSAELSKAQYAHASARDKLIAELKVSEKAYGRILECVLAFKKRLEKVITGDQLFAVFGNIHEIARFHEVLRTAFDQDHKQSIAQTFVKYGDFLKLYNLYADRYKTSLAATQLLYSTNPAVQLVMVEMRQTTLCAGRSLPLLLPIPLERLRHYELFISELKRLTPASHTEASAVGLAYDKLTALSAYARVHTAALDAMVSLLAVADRISGYDGPGPSLTATPGRYLIREGVLKKDSTQALVKCFKARTVFLFNDLLLWTTVTNGKCRGHLLLQHAALQTRAHLDPKDKPLEGFVVHTKERTLAIACDTPEQAKSWRADIAKAIELLHARSSVQAQLLAGRGAAANTLSPPAAAGAGAGAGARSSNANAALSPMGSGASPFGKAQTQAHASPQPGAAVVSPRGPAPPSALPPSAALPAGAVPSATKPQSGGSSGSAATTPAGSRSPSPFHAASTATAAAPPSMPAPQQLTAQPPAGAVPPAMLRPVSLPPPHPGSSAQQGASLVPPPMPPLPAGLILPPHLVAALPGSAPGDSKPASANATPRGSVTAPAPAPAPATASVSAPNAAPRGSVTGGPRDSVPSGPFSLIVTAASTAADDTATAGSGNNSGANSTTSTATNAAAIIAAAGIAPAAVTVAGNNSPPTVATAGSTPPTGVVVPPPALDMRRDSHSTTSQPGTAGPGVSVVITSGTLTIGSVHSTTSSNGTTATAATQTLLANAHSGSSPASSLRSGGTHSPAPSIGTPASVMSGPAMAPPNTPAAVATPQSAGPARDSPGASAATPMAGTPGGSLLPLPVVGGAGFAASAGRRASASALPSGLGTAPAPPSMLGGPGGVHNLTLPKGFAIDANARRGSASLIPLNTGQNPAGAHAAAVAGAALMANAITATLVAADSGGVSRPFNVQHNTHVTRDFQWSGENLEEMLELKDKLGEGSFGEVWRAVHRTAKFELAVKLLLADPNAHESESAYESTLKEIKDEIEILKQCRHANIVSYLGTWGPDTRGRLWILMDLCEIGSIGDLRNRTKTQCHEKQVAYIMSQTLRALVYLHAKKIVHRDIKGNNILLTKTGAVKLADFGVSKSIATTTGKTATIGKGAALPDDGKDDHTAAAGAGAGGKTAAAVAAAGAFGEVVGSPLWMAPEVITGVPGNFQADIWSLGITAIEVAEGEPPHANLSASRLLRTIVNAPPPTPKLNFWSSKFRDFVAKCLVKDPKQRPSAVDLCSHPFILGAPQSSASLTPLIKRFLHLPKPTADSAGVVGSFDLIKRAHDAQAARAAAMEKAKAAAAAAAPPAAPAGPKKKTAAELLAEVEAAAEAANAAGKGDAKGDDDDASVAGDDDDEVVTNDAPPTGARGDPAANALANKRSRSESVLDLDPSQGDGGASNFDDGDDDDMKAAAKPLPTLKRNVSDPLSGAGAGTPAAAAAASAPPPSASSGAAKAVGVSRNADDLKLETLDEGDTEASVRLSAEPASAGGMAGGRSGAPVPQSSPTHAILAADTDGTTASPFVTAAAAAAAGVSLAPPPKAAAGSDAATAAAVAPSEPAAPAVSVTPNGDAPAATPAPAPSVSASAPAPGDDGGPDFS